MLAKAAVLCGKNTIQVRELELPPIGDDELLVKNISNSICLSTYKAALLGEEHKRVPEHISEHPPITGHEFTGIIMETISGTGFSRVRSLCCSLRWDFQVVIPQATVMNILGVMPPIALFRKSPLSWGVYSLIMESTLRMHHLVNQCPALSGHIMQPIIQNSMYMSISWA